MREPLGSKAHNLRPTPLDDPASAVILRSILPHEPVHARARGGVLDPPRVEVRREAGDEGGARSVLGRERGRAEERAEDEDGGRDGSVFEEATGSTQVMKEGERERTHRACSGAACSVFRDTLARRPGRAAHMCRSP